MKKLMCLLTALTLALSVPIVSGATSVELSNASKYLFRIMDKDSGEVYYASDSYVGNDYVVDIPYDLAHTFNHPVRVSYRFNVLALLSETQKAMIKTADTVRLDVSWNMYLSTDPYDDTLESWESGFGTGSYVKYNSYHSGVVDPWLLATFFDGKEFHTTFNIGSAILGEDLEKAYFYLNCDIKPEIYNGVYREILAFNSRINYMTFMFTMTGVDGSSSKIIVELKDINEALGDVQDSINQGFDSILTPDASDKQQSDKFGSEMSDKVQQGGQIIDQMGDMQKPDIDLVMPDDLLSDDEADAMITLMDTVQPILGSALIGRTLLIGLILALIAYIFFGKR